MISSFIGIFTRFCPEITQNAVKNPESSTKSTFFKDFSLFSKRFLDTMTKGNINSWNFYKSWNRNMFHNFRKNAANWTFAFNTHNITNGSRAFPFFFILLNCDLRVKAWISSPWVKWWNRFQNIFPLVNGKNLSENHKKIAFFNPHRIFHT